MKVLAVGDIHTKLWIIDSVEQVIDNYDAVVFVGDYADDWNATAIRTIKTWKALKSLQKRYPKVNIVLGNHDYIYGHYTKTISSGYNRMTQMLLDAPENKKLKEWLTALPIICVVDGVTYSHAGLTTSWDYGINSANLWIDDSPLWARPQETTYGEQYQNTPQVFGHTPSKTCWEVQENIWCIDTFSTYPDDTPIGDCTVLEVVDGVDFNKIKFEKQK